MNPDYDPYFEKPPQIPGVTSHQADASTGYKSALLILLTAIVGAVLGGVLTSFLWVTDAVRKSDPTPVSNSEPVPAASPANRIEPSVEHLQSLRQLISTKLEITDILVGEGEGVRGAWLIKGDALLGIELNEVQIVEVDRAAKTAVISLPVPEVLWSRVDHDRSMTYDIGRTTWLPWKGDKAGLQQSAMYHAQKLIEHAASRAEKIEEAKQHASLALSEVYRVADWKIDIRWK